MAVEWLVPRCDICGGLGAAVEQRVVGDVMVDESGHKWISAVMGRKPTSERVYAGFMEKLERSDPNHPWVAIWHSRGGAQI